MEKQSDCPTEPVLTKNQIYKVCEKCSKNASVVLPGNHIMCKECFFKAIREKFTRTLNTQKLITFEEDVIIAYSGGLYSSCLLKLVQSQLARSKETNFRYNPVVVYVDDRSNTELVHRLTASTKVFGFYLHMVYTETESVGGFSRILNPLSNFAKSSGINKVLLGCSASHSAVEAFEHLVVGDALGSVTACKTAFEHDNVLFVRALMDLSPKEIGVFHSLSGLNAFNYDENKLKGEKTVTKVISDFLFELQKTHSLTLPAIKSTLQKVQLQSDDSEQ